MSGGELSAGDLVWAKMVGYPHWPAMVMESGDVPVPTPPGHRPVLFFGTNETGFIRSSQLFPYLAHRALYERPKKLRGFRAALGEIRREAGLDDAAPDGAAQDAQDDDLPDDERATDAAAFAKALGKGRISFPAAPTSPPKDPASPSPKRPRTDGSPASLASPPAQPRDDEEARESLLVEFQSSLAPSPLRKTKKPKQKLKVAIGAAKTARRTVQDKSPGGKQSKPSGSGKRRLSSPESPEEPLPELAAEEEVAEGRPGSDTRRYGDGGGMRECGECGAKVRPETGGATGTYRLRCSSKACRKWWGLVDRELWMQRSNYMPKRMRDMQSLRSQGFTTPSPEVAKSQPLSIQEARAKREAYWAGVEAGLRTGLESMEAASDAPDDLGDLEVSGVGSDDALESYQRLMEQEEAASSPESRVLRDGDLRRVSFSGGEIELKGPGRPEEMLEDEQGQKRCSLCGFIVRPYTGVTGRSGAPLWRCLAQKCLRFYGTVERESEVEPYRPCEDCGGPQRLRQCPEPDAPSEMRYQCWECQRQGDYIWPHSLSLVQRRLLGTNAQPKGHGTRRISTAKSPSPSHSAARSHSRPQPRASPQRAKKSIPDWMPELRDQGRELPEGLDLLGEARLGAGPERGREAGREAGRETGREGSGTEERRGLVERKSRWWLGRRRPREELSPPRELGGSVVDAAATLRTVGESLASMGERLRRLNGTSAERNVGATMDLLLDSLLSSLPPLLSLGALQPHLPHLTPDQLRPLLENTTPIVPIFNA